MCINIGVFSENIFVTASKKRLYQRVLSFYILYIKIDIRIDRFDKRNKFLMDIDVVID